MYSLWWLLLASSVCRLTEGTGVTITAAENSAYYKNASMVITCGFSGFSDAPSSFGLVYSANSKSVKFGCHYDSGVQRFMDFKLDYTGQMISPTAADCQRIFPNTSANRNLQLRVEFTLIQAGDFKCECYVGPGNYNVSSPFHISTLRVEPTSIDLSLTPESSIIIAGNRLAVSCASSGGIPASNFTYGIGDEELSGTTFTAESKHNDKMLSCLDREHSRYLGENHKTWAGRLLTVYFIELDGDARQTFVRNPCDQNELILECFVRFNAAKGAQVQFTWVKNGTPFDHHAKTYEIPLSNLTQSGTTDTYKCTASVALLNSTKNVTKSFEIRWDRSAHDCITTTPTPITTEGSFTTVAIIIGVVVGVLLIIVVVSLIVYCVKRKGSGLVNVNGYTRANIAIHTAVDENTLYEEVSSSIRPAIQVNRELQSQDGPYELLSTATNICDDHQYNSLRRYENVT